MKTVLVLNASYEPHQRVTVKKAVGMLCRGVARIEEAIDGHFIGPFPYPAVLILVKYVKMTWRPVKPTWSRKRLFVRDKGICAFKDCTSKATTVEHVKPQSRGGETTWVNTVAACFPCNSKKRNRTLEESGMKLKYPPFAPTWEELMLDDQHIFVIR